MQTDILSQIITKIIRQQALVIGPLAWSEASKVPGLKILDQQKGEVAFNNGDQKGIIDKLVAQYDRLFGQASREVSREAAASLIAGMPPAEIPSSLK